MRRLIKRGGYTVLFCLVFGIGQSKAGDSTYLDIRKIEITDTFVLKALGHYVDSLKKVHINGGKWYLSLFINNGFEQSDTAAVITVGCVDYPLNPDKPDREYPNYYAMVKGSARSLPAGRTAICPRSFGNKLLYGRLEKGAHRGVEAISSAAPTELSRPRQGWQTDEDL